MDSRDRIVLGSADLRDDDVTPRLLEAFLEEGGRAIDLANVYADGESERAVGRWLSGSGAEPTLYVKGCHPPHCSPALVEAEVDRARSELGIDALDVFMLHRDDLAFPVNAFAEALVDQVGRGAIRSFGVSNWTVARFDELVGALGADPRQLVAFSNHFSLAEMVTPTWPGCLAMDTDDITFLEQAGVTPLAWASIANGYFAGRDNPSWRSGPNHERRRRAQELAADRGTTATTVALAYVLRRSACVHAVVGTRSEQHLRELFEATTLEISGEEVAWLQRG